MLVAKLPGSTQAIEATTAGPTKAKWAVSPLRRPASTSRAVATLRAVSVPEPAITIFHDPRPSGIRSRAEPALGSECSIGYIIGMMRLLSMETTLYRLNNTLQAH